MSTNRIIVIGGGPAGMMAAGRAAECGAEVLLLERGPRLGRKLRISGKGRGNITNTADIPDFVDAFGPNGKFLYGAFSRFFREELIALLRNLGVETKIERGGRIFPVSDRASDVADALERWLINCGVEVRLNARAKAIERADSGVVGVRLYGGRMDAGAVVLATGGASYPKTGSTGDGYTMAAALGHTIVPPKPALAALVTHEDWVRNLQGLSLKNVSATLLHFPGVHADPPLSDRSGISRIGPISGVQPRTVAREFGEMLFTHFGISGPIILTLSRGVTALLAEGSVQVSIDLKPALSHDEIHQRLIRDFKQPKHLKNYLKELLPRLLIPTFLELADLDPDKPVHSVMVEERARIVELLKDLRVTISGMAPLEEAIVTAGGVSTREIDPKTMMSKLVPGLFFAGEIIDVDARTGGFNLQAAFSTGWVAGEAVARGLTH